MPSAWRAFGRLLATHPFGRSLLLDGVLLGVGEPFGLVLLGVGLLADLGVELELLALHLLVGDPDVLHLELHLTGLDRLRVGDVDLLAMEATLRLSALSASAISVSTPILFCSFLLPRLLLLDLGIAVGGGGGDAGVLERLLDLGLAEGVEIALVILDGLEDKGTELESPSPRDPSAPHRAPCPGSSSAPGTAPRP